jgi:hypothetical protein
VDHHVEAQAAAIPERIQLSPWDDGFTTSGCNGRPGKIVRDFPRDHPGVDGAVSERTADLLYASAVRATVWGVYVPVSERQLEEAGDAARETPELERDEAESPEAYRHALARQTVQEFLVGNDGGQRISKSDWQRTHGVAVWVIASGCDDETGYHVDYAEQLRFETNVVFPPTYGATQHVSPLHDADSDGEQEETSAPNQTRATSAFEAAAST